VVPPYKLRGAGHRFSASANGNEIYCIHSHPHDILLLSSHACREELAMMNIYIILGLCQRLRDFHCAERTQALLRRQACEELQSPMTGYMRLFYSCYTEMKTPPHGIKHVRTPFSIHFTAASHILTPVMYSGSH